MDYRLVLFLYRKEGITHAEELTGSLFPSIHSRRYIERSSEGQPNVLIGDKSGQECDAVVEIAFKDEEAAQAFFAATNAGETQQRLRKDTAQFLDGEKLRMVKVGEAFETHR
ncbi:uncharacterized protein ColSpa_07037 [Colletotrichum spaethianum]|uniref:EthD domain-containing protein n=1 Tax=Colletotrichum spaethianum TaxID=700344 RepID=A0AA37LDX0_9PEZI|nr:uncharacterized protein ColSpa_07037 [Colletotrichum spaethianum]GKT46856.1 hypothetical protein ColSpa_07037 [Colletotrichum spaethianum]